jgi:hypothetical protein
LDFPLRRSGGGMSRYCLLCGPVCDGKPHGIVISGYDVVLALDNATSSAFDAYQVTEADVVGGDVVAL